jgi:hypothetical protein
MATLTGSRPAMANSLSAQPRPPGARRPRDGSATAVAPKSSASWRRPGSGSDTMTMAPASAASAAAASPIMPAPATSTVRPSSPQLGPDRPTESKRRVAAVRRAAAARATAPAVGAKTVAGVVSSTIATAVPAKT